MSDTNIVHCVCLNSYDYLWDTIGHDCQIFYDNRSKIFTFRRGFEFYLKPPNIFDPAQIKPFKIPMRYFIT